ncbi:MAG: hypothetical protein GTN39_01965, partial [Candidatus Aenigmarchaeota archaeon]|nr:hypothetical protein [Candidatus Aenigmarchaeota archaeon]
LLIFFALYLFLHPLFMSCRAGGIACRQGEAQEICDQRNMEFRTSCENLGISLAVVFLIISYLFSSHLVFKSVNSRINLFIKKSFWKLLILTIILTLLSLLYAYEPLVMDAYFLERGFPLGYLSYSVGTFVPPNAPPPVGGWRLIPEFLFLDFVFWYVISMIVLKLYYRRKKPKLAESLK